MSSLPTVALTMVQGVPLQDDEPAGSVTVKNSFVHVVLPVDEAESPTMRRYGSESRLILPILPSFEAKRAGSQVQLQHAQDLVDSVEQENKALEALIALGEQLLEVSRRLKN
eukprot:gb/GFBE01028968.1/.p1 GENE.gb/GFBE01028968.1/~~gb/GFBE01028968.1/.p1  ORF type:complete len:112 (+),score=28.71 gb/GFBE01028968.1/:1-336(+)